MTEEGDFNESKVSKEMDTEICEQRSSDETLSKGEETIVDIGETHDSHDQVVADIDEAHDGHDQVVSEAPISCDNEMSDTIDLPTEKFKKISLGESHLESRLNLDKPPKDSPDTIETENDSNQSAEKSESNVVIQLQWNKNDSENTNLNKVESKVDSNEKNVQDIDKKVKDLKSNNPPQSPMSPSLRRVRRAGQTPRAKSTPSRAPTSPPMTRSKSRELRLQSTPGNIEGRKGSDDQLNEEGKVPRGRQRQRKDL